MGGRSRGLRTQCQLQQGAAAWFTRIRERFCSVALTTRKCFYTSFAFGQCAWCGSNAASAQPLLAVPTCPHPRCPSAGGGQGPTLPTHSPADPWHLPHTPARVGACPVLIWSLVFVVWILFQAIQERLQAGVSQRSCFLLVNRCNSLAKSVLGKKTTQMTLCQILLVLPLIKKNHTKPYLLLETNVTNILPWNNYIFKMTTYLFVILKWFLIIWLCRWRFMWMNLIK